MRPHYPHGQYTCWGHQNRPIRVAARPLDPTPAGPKPRFAASWRLTAARSPNTHHTPPRLSGWPPTGLSLAQAPGVSGGTTSSARSGHLRGTQGCVRASGELGSSWAAQELGEVEKIKVLGSDRGGWAARARARARGPRLWNRPRRLLESPIEQRLRLDLLPR